VTFEKYAKQKLLPAAAPLGMCQYLTATAGASNANGNQASSRERLGDTFDLVLLAIRPVAFGASASWVMVSIIKCYAVTHAIRRLSTLTLIQQTTEGNTERATVEL